MEYFISALKKFTVFSGRASLKEYWMFTLFLFIFSLSFGFLDLIVMNVLETSGFLNSLFSLAMFLPSTAIAVRRLHDINKSGKMILINFIPLIGPIWFLILMIKKGDTGENQYGPVPVEGENTTASEEKNTSNLEFITNPNQETPQPTVAQPVPQQVINQQQVVEQPPLQPVQPIQEITVPAQEKQTFQN